MYLAATVCVQTESSLILAIIVWSPACCLAITCLMLPECLCGHKALHGFTVLPNGAHQPRLPRAVQHLHQLTNRQWKFFVSNGTVLLVHYIDVTLSGRLQ